MPRERKHIQEMAIGRREVLGGDRNRRDMFAAAALPAVVASPAYAGCDHAEMAIALADDVIAKLDEDAAAPANAAHDSKCQTLRNNARRLASEARRMLPHGDWSRSVDPFAARQLVAMTEAVMTLANAVDELSDALQLHVQEPGE